jgi:hypothetical protein
MALWEAIGPGCMAVPIDRAFRPYEMTLMFSLRLNLGLQAVRVLLAAVGPLLVHLELASEDFHSHQELALCICHEQCIHTECT